ncbi:hypothetical protein UFOVP630_7 [uncultured Caudovirales phage]|uniref:Uncharacterized protein n=1 Tax=uncultured Caudovirales phage TaxID=2100421 RepID=A0A6J5N5G7_9CAUD|nr:hypothetical protein UFOVP630_7 [uncultured Caudovirales phage]
MYIIVYKKQIIKMDKTKLIESIKSQLKSLMSNEVKFAEIKAGDLMINCPDEECVVGSEVFTVDVDGNNIPLADGDYTLDSGETISVVSGKVSAIAITETPVEAEVEVEVESPEGEASAEEDVATEEDVTETPEDMKALMARVAKCEAMLEEMSKANNKMAQELSKVSNEPSTTSISIEPTEFKSVEEKKEGSGAVDIMAIRERARANRK